MTQTKKEKYHLFTGTATRDRRSNDFAELVAIGTEVVDASIALYAVIVDNDGEQLWSYHRGRNFKTMHHSHGRAPGLLPQIDGSMVGPEHPNWAALYRAWEETSGQYRTATEIAQTCRTARDSQRCAAMMLREISSAIDYLASASNTLTSWGLADVRGIEETRDRLNRELTGLRQLALQLAARFDIDQITSWWDDEAVFSVTHN